MPNVSAMSAVSRPARHLVGVEPLEIFQHRRLNGGGVVAVLKDGARQGAVVDALGANIAVGGPAPPTADDAETVIPVVVSGGPDDKRNQDAALANGRLNVGHVRRFASIVHVRFVHEQLVMFDKCEFHGRHLS
jgi:hypothetical protein